MADPPDRSIRGCFLCGIPVTSYTNLRFAEQLRQIEGLWFVVRRFIAGVHAQ